MCGRLGCVVQRAQLTNVQQARLTNVQQARLTQQAWLHNPESGARCWPPSFLG